MAPKEKIHDVEATKPKTRDEVERENVRSLAGTIPTVVHLKGLREERVKGEKSKLYIEATPSNAAPVGIIVFTVGANVTADVAATIVKVG